MQISSQERLQLLTDFAEFLRDVAKHQCTAYYYVISGGEVSAPSSLCHLCGLSDEDFRGLLIAANLATYDIQNRKLSIKHDQWCKFIDTYDLSDLIKKVAATKLQEATLQIASIIILSEWECTEVTINFRIRWT
jgi:hypothetical protein